VIRLRSASYDDSSDTVTLTPIRAFELKRRVEVQVIGLMDRFGRLIDGQAGDDSVAVLSAGDAVISTAAARADAVDWLLEDAEPGGFTALSGARLFSQGRK
jgi:hypothetical protein